MVELRKAFISFMETPRENQPEASEEQIQDGAVKPGKRPLRIIKRHNGEEPDNAVTGVQVGPIIEEKPERKKRAFTENDYKKIAQVFEVEQPQNAIVAGEEEKAAETLKREAKEKKIAESFENVKDVVTPDARREIDELYQGGRLDDIQAILDKLGKEKLERIAPMATEVAKAKLRRTSLVAKPTPGEKETTPTVPVGDTGPLATSDTAEMPRPPVAEVDPTKTEHEKAEDIIEGEFRYVDKTARNPDRLRLEGPSKEKSLQDEAERRREAEAAEAKRKQEERVEQLKIELRRDANKTYDEYARNPDKRNLKTRAETIAEQRKEKIDELWREDYRAAYARLGPEHPFTNFYEVLGISIDASIEEIKEAHRREAKNCHPDLHPDDPNAKKKFMALQEAFDCLNNGEKRKIYNLEPALKLKPGEKFRTEQQKEFDDLATGRKEHKFLTPYEIKYLFTAGVTLEQIKSIKKAHWWSDKIESSLSGEPVSFEHFHDEVVNGIIKRKDQEITQRAEQELGNKWDENRRRTINLMVEKGLEEKLKLEEAEKAKKAAESAETAKAKIKRAAGLWKSAYALDKALRRENLDKFKYKRGEKVYTGDKARLEMKNDKDRISTEIVKLAGELSNRNLMKERKKDWTEKEFHKYITSQVQEIMEANGIEFKKSDLEAALETTHQDLEAFKVSGVEKSARKVRAVKKMERPGIKKRTRLKPLIKRSKKKLESYE